MSAPSDRARPTLSGDIAGAFGDLGTLLPLVLAALTVTKLPAVGVLVGFGIAYGLTAAVFRAPIPVQPMKVAAAVLIATAPPVEAIIGAGLVMGLFFLIAGAGGLIARLARWLPGSVTAGLQIGLGGTLGWLALLRIAEAPVFGAGLLVLLAFLLRRPSWPAAVILLIVGIAAGTVLGIVPPAPLPQPQPAWPTVQWPSTGAVLDGLFTIALPQIPLTLTNAVLVTAALGRDYFPQARGLDATRLSLTTGAMNLITAPFAAMPMCHGAGGLAAHYRFGSRTGRTPAMLAAGFLALGLIWGEAALALLARVPAPVLGALLLVPAIDLIGAAQPMQWSRREGALVAGVAALAFWSPGIAFVAGLATAVVLRGFR